MTAQGAIRLDSNGITVTWNENDNAIVIHVNGDCVAMSYNQARHVREILEFLFKEQS